jgi:hypothetical protein
MTNEIDELSAPCTPLAYDHLAEVITRAIGANDPYPNDAQMVAHRARQICNERFLNIESKEMTK